MQSLVAAGAFILVLQQAAPNLVWAANGTWSETTGDGAWSNAANWSGGTVGDGSGNTADFSQVNLDAQAVYNLFGNDGVGNPLARNAVNLDSARTIGNLTFGDTNLTSPGAFEVYSLNYATNLLTLAGTTPTITVNPLTPINTSALVGATPVTPENLDDAIIRTTLVGTSGFTKMGTGILTLVGTNPNLTGVIKVDQGTLRVGPLATFDTEIAVTPAITTFNLAAGTTLTSAANVQNITAANGVVFNTSGGGLGAGGTGAAGVGAGIIVAPGGSITINNSAAGAVNMGGASGTGSTVTMNMSGGLTRLDKDWARTGNLAVVNLNGTNPALTQSAVNIRVNGGLFNGNGWSATTVNLNNVLVDVAQSTGGNTLNIGALNATANATLQGGTGGVGSSTLIIGALGTDMNFAGNIAATVPADPTTTSIRSLNIVKVGAGTMTLSGNLTYRPANEPILNRQGGITRVEVGTLKLTGVASLPAGVANATTITPAVALGDLLTSVDIRAGATLDVSETTNPYSTPALHQVVGAGKIVGNYNHDEGTLAPGDGLVGANTSTLVNTAGTLTFDNNLGFAGNGGVMFSMAATPAGANDLIQVNGTTNLAGSPTVTPTFTATVPVAGQVYTLLTSAGGFGGSTPAGWVVKWPGRGAGPTPVVSGNTVQITTTAIVSNSLNWSGQTNGNWDLATQNFYNNTSSAADKYVEFDSVTFGDTFNGGSPTPVSNPTVTLNFVANPSSVTINSNTTNYTISGTGRIAGSGSLTKSGTSTLTMTTGNTYGGGTTISGGIVNRDATGGFGSGSITLSGGELQSRAWTTTNPIVVPAANTGKLRAIGGVVATPLTPGDVAVASILLDGAISGSGNLEFHNDSLTTNATTLAREQQVQAVDVRASNSGFTGSVSFKGASPIALRLTVAGAEGTNAAWDLGSNGSSIGVLFGVATPTTVKFGSLSGGAAAPSGATTNLQGRNSSGGLSPVVYEIGSLNTDTTFAGNILSGRIDGTPPRPENTTSLTKVGTGTLTLSNMDSALVPVNYVLYQGDTRVQGGKLSIQRAYLADTADVFISNGAIFDLNFGAVADTIDSLYLGGSPVVPGTYGSLASAATNKSNFFLGLGTLQVTTLGAALGFTGDYNGDGRVDAADYTVWRDNLGGLGTTLQHRDPANGAGVVSTADYASWKANFGMGPGSGGGSLTSVPEPTSLMLVMMALGMVAAAGSRRRG